MNVLRACFDWTLIFVLGVPLVFIACGVGIVSPRLAHRVAVKFDRLVIRIFRIRVVVHDENLGNYPEKGQLFVTLNQTSLIELFAVATTLPTYTKNVANFEYALFFPVAGWYCLAVRDVILIRQWPAQAKRALNRACQLLATQCNFWISIEGRRSDDGTLSPYKKGPVVMAIQAQAEIVPLSIRGAFELMPKGAWFPKSGVIHVTYHKKISVKGMQMADREALLEILRKLGERATTSVS